MKFNLTRQEETFQVIIYQVQKEDKFYGAKFHKEQKKSQPPNTHENHQHLLKRVLSTLIKTFKSMKLMAKKKKLIIKFQVRKQHDESR